MLSTKPVDVVSKEIVDLYYRRGPGVRKSSETTRDVLGPFLLDGFDQPVVVILRGTNQSKTEPVVGNEVSRPLPRGRN